MVFKSYRKKRTYRRRANRTTMYKIAKKVLNANTEFKAHNVVLGSFSVVDSGTQDQWTNISQTGNSNTDRNGAKIMLKSIHLKGLIQLNDAGTPTTSAVRVMVILDRQTNGALFSPDDLLFSTASHQALISSRSVHQMARFKVLFDRLVHVSPQGPQTKIINFYKRCSFPIHYKNNTATITDLKSNSLSVYYVSDISALNSPPKLTYNLRLRYTDI